MQRRVAVYIDGFNLYNGLRAKHEKRYLWLDLHEVCKSFLRPDQTLIRIGYFTAPVRGDRFAAEQAIYLDALRATSSILTVTEGRFLEKPVQCPACGDVRMTYEEKETDVNIAVSLVEDAAGDRYDTALLITGDSDLCPAIRSVRRLRPTKRVLVAFPPLRSTNQLRQTAHGTFSISGSRLRGRLLPDVVTTDTGVKLIRPERWH